MHETFPVWRKGKNRQRTKPKTPVPQSIQQLLVALCVRCMQRCPDPSFLQMHPWASLLQNMKTKTTYFCFQVDKTRRWATQMKDACVCSKQLGMHYCLAKFHVPNSYRFSCWFSLPRKELMLECRFHASVSWKCNENTKELQLFSLWSAMKHL